MNIYIIQGDREKHTYMVDLNISTSHFYFILFIILFKSDQAPLLYYQKTFSIHQSNQNSSIRSILSVSLNLSSVLAHPNTITILYSPFLSLKQVDKHPPAFDVIPVFIPMIPSLPNNLLVFFQKEGFTITFPLMWNFNFPL